LCYEKYGNVIFSVFILITHVKQHDRMKEQIPQGRHFVTDVALFLRHIH